MKKRQRKKFASIDASGVKKIAEMQEYIDYLENNIWRLFMFTRGQDDCQSLAVFEKFKGEMSQFAMEGLYNFIKEQKGKIEEIESLLTQSDDVDDIVYSYHQIESKIEEHKEDKK